MKYLATLLLAFLLPLQAFAAIAVDNTGQTSTSGVDGGKTLSFTTAGTNNLLVVCAFSVAQNAVTAVSYAGTAMTLVSREFQPALGEISQWYVLGKSGTNNIVSTVTSNFNLFTAVSYTGVLQTGFPDTASSSNQTGNVSSLSIFNTVGSNAWLSSCIGSANSAPTAGAGTTLRITGSNVAVTQFDSNGAVSGATSLTANVSPATILNGSMISFLPVASATINWVSLIWFGWF